MRLVRGSQDAVAAEARFDRVLANLDGRTLEGLVGPLLVRCAIGGRLGVAGLLISEREGFLDSLRGLPAEVLDERTDTDDSTGDEWWSAWLGRGGES